MPLSLKNKKIAMIIAFQDFRDEEYFIPRRIFEDKGAKVETFSSKKGQALATYGGVVEVDYTLKELKVKNFDAVIFCGGSGAQGFIDDKDCWEIARETVKENKVLGAICIAPLILARAGVLKGKKATVWSSDLNRQPIKSLEKEGAQYLAKKVVVDENIVTANGPQSAHQFANTIAKILSQT